MGDYLRRMKSKLGPAGATTATAHKIAVNLLHHGKEASRIRCCLIHLAGEIASGDIFTLDRDFEVYRWGRNHAFRMLIPLK